MVPRQPRLAARAAIQAAGLKHSDVASELGNCARLSRTSRT